MSVGKTKDGRWYVSFRDSNGKVRREYFGRGNLARSAAETRDLEIKLEKKRGVEILPSQTYLDDLSQMYLAEKKRLGKTIAWRKELANLLNKTILPVLSAKPIEKITYQDISTVLEFWDDLSTATQNRYASYLKAIFEFGVTNDMISKNPMAKWKKAREHRRESQLTVRDLKAIMENAAPHLAWAIEVQWNLGTRPGKSELTAIQWTDVNFEQKEVRVRGTKTATSNRIIPVSDSFLDRLREKKIKAKSLYVIEYGGRQVKKFRRSFKTACEKAGIEYNVRMYDIRHLFASASLSGGADLAAVSQLLGHASTKMTADTYYHVLAGEKRRAINTLPDLSGVEPSQKVINFPVNGSQKSGQHFDQQTPKKTPILLTKRKKDQTK